MYSESFTQKQIEALAAQTGWAPAYNSIARVEAAVKHFDSITEKSEKGEPKGWTRPLDAQEAAFVRNENLLSRLDFRYWSTRYFFIKDKEHVVRRFTPNVSQGILFDIWGESEEKSLAIETLELKARRLGVSTANEGVIAHRTFYVPGTNSLIASSDPERSREMSKMFETAFDNLPWWNRPVRTKYSAGELMEFARINAGLSIQWGNQTTGIARGSTPGCTHLSELPDFADPAELVDASLMRAILPAPHIFTVLESTAKGRGDWWHGKWSDAKEHWHKGESRLRPVFLPWYVGSDIYPMPAWTRARAEKFATWEPLPITVAHAESAQKFVRAHDVLRRHLGADWAMPREQMFYWEVEREEARRTKQLSKFLEEMPADDIEAFQSPHAGAFDAELVYEIKSKVPEPEAVYGIRANESLIPLRYQPSDSEIDESYKLRPDDPKVVKPLTVTANWLRSIEPDTFTLVPLKFAGYSETSPVNKFFVFEQPKVGEEYGLGVDPSWGKGKDNSAVEVLRRGSPERNEAQVAEFVSPYINGLDLWAQALCIGTLYSTVVEGQRRQARIAIEIQAANGEATQRELQRRGWWNFHERLPQDKRVVQLGGANKVGWWTSGKSREKITERMEKAIVDSQIDILSYYLVEELGGLEWDLEKDRIQASHGAHDDRFMALSIILESLRGAEVLGSRESTWQRRRQAKVEAQKEPEYDVGDFGRINRKRDESRLVGR